MTLLTLFTAPKPFTNPHIATIQRNALRSWVALGSEVEVIVVGEEEGLAEAAAELGICHLNGIKRTPGGTPLVGSIFELARQHGHGEIMGYVNADIMLLPSILDSVRTVASQVKNFLIVGQRWDLNVRHLIDFSDGWDTRLVKELKEHGRQHPPAGSDYFLFPRGCFETIPNFAIGRAGWDNWMIYEARQRGWAVVNASSEICIIHQDHDYSHLPGGKPHYRHPETYENVRLAGGKRTIFRLEDADRQLANGKIKPAPLSWKKLWREVEIFPMVRLHSRLLTQLFFAIFHPVKAYGELREWMRVDQEETV